MHCIFWFKRTSLKNTCSKDVFADTFIIFSILLVQTILGPHESACRWEKQGHWEEFQLSQDFAEASGLTRLFWHKTLNHGNNQDIGPSPSWKATVSMPFNLARVATELSEVC